MVGRFTGSACHGRFVLAFAVASGVGVVAWRADAAMPLFAQGAAGLVAPGGVEQLAKPAAGAAGAAAAGAAAEGAAEGVAKPADKNAVLIKYAPSYALLVLVLALGMFIVCRPSPRPVDETKPDKKSDKKKK